MVYFLKPIKIFIGILCLLGALVAYKLFFVKSPPQEEDVKVVEVEKVSLNNIKEVVRLIGTVEPKRSTTFFAKSKGVWEAVLKEGEFVKEGTLIGQIESTDLEKKYILSQRAEKIARDQYERSVILRKAGYLSTQGFEEKKTGWILAQKESFTAKMDLEKACFYAPFDGILGVFKERSGAYVNEGDVLVSFYDPSDLVVEFEIPSSLVRFIKEGQSLEIEGKKYELTHLQKIVNPETHMCPAYVNIQSEDHIIGASIAVDLTVREKKGVLVIPFEAIFIQDGETAIYCVKEGKAVLSKVDMGLREKDKTEILSGLKEGDHLILRGQQRLYPGVSVRVYEASSALSPSHMPLK